MEEENQEDWQNAWRRGAAEGKATRAEASRQANEKVNLYMDSISPIRNIKADICWSVACAETVEGRYNIGKTRAEKLSLSPQFLLDYIVIGNTTDTVANFKNATDLVHRKGLPKEENYKFLGKRGRKKPENLLGLKKRISGAEELTEGITEDRVKALLDAGEGPLLIVFDTDIHFIQLKSGDLYRGPVRARGELPNLHDVVVIGYGKSGKEKFWKVRNCYDTTWCDGGYGHVSTSIMIERVWYPTGFDK